MHFELPKEENLSTKNKSAEFVLYPKCPSTVVAQAYPVAQ